MSKLSIAKAHQIELDLDLHTQRSLKLFLDAEIGAHRLNFCSGECLDLSRASGTGMSRLKEMIEDRLPMIDLDAGGVRLFRLHHRGRPVDFLLAPGTVPRGFGGGLKLKIVF